MRVGYCSEWSGTCDSETYTHTDDMFEGSTDLIRMHPVASGDARRVSCYMACVPSGITFHQPPLGISGSYHAVYKLQNASMTICVLPSCPLAPHASPANVMRLSVRLGNTLQLVLLLDRIRVRRTLGSVDHLLSKALSNRLDVSESSFSCADGDQGDSLVNSSKR